nr:hypothetical protein [Tanacetum cinerariifolium]
VENFKNSSKSLNKLLDSQIANKCKAGLGYNVVPPPYTRNFLPLKPDLSGLQEFENEHIVSKTTIKKHVVETSQAKISDSEDEDESRPTIKKKTVKPSFAEKEFVKSKEPTKSPRKTTVKQVTDMLKNDKIKAKTDKTEHEMEKRKKSRSTKSKSTKVKVKDGAKTKEMLNG